MKRALVVGGAGGIGRATTALLVGRGVEVYVTGRSRAEAPEGAIFIEASVGTAEGRARIAEAVEGSLDLLVHAAGVNPRERFEAMREETLREAFEVNFFGPLLLTQALSPKLGEGASVAFVSSTLAARAAKGALGYAASKGALEAAVRALALELAERGARAFAVAPGLVDTSMMREGRSEAELSALAALSPLGRVGKPEEVAAFLVAAAENPFLTGVVLTLDGGMTAGFAL